MSNFKRKEIMVDENLSSILNVPIGSHISFAELTKKVYDYINVQNLRIGPTLKARSRRKREAKKPRFCFKCGSELSPNSKFCDRCGRMQ